MDLGGAVFTGYVFNKSDFSESNLKDANFQDATLKDVVFANADLQRASLVNASIDGADFTGANLADVDFYGASIRGAIFRSTLYEDHAPDPSRHVLQGVRSVRNDGISANLWPLADHVAGVLVALIGKTGDEGEVGIVEVAYRLLQTRRVEDSWKTVLSFLTTRRELKREISFEMVALAALLYQLQPSKTGSSMALSPKPRSRLQSAIMALIDVVGQDGHQARIPDQADAAACAEILGAGDAFVLTLEHRPSR